MKKVHLAAASALLSVLLVSGFAQAATKAPAPDAAKPAATEAAKPAKPALSEEKAKLFREATAKVHEANKANFEKIQQLHKELGDIIKAPTFDKSAYIAKEAEIGSIHQKIAESRTAAMADVFGQLTAEERASMPMHPMMKGPRGDGMMKGGHHGRGPMPMTGEAPAAEAKE